MLYYRPVVALRRSYRGSVHHHIGEGRAAGEDGAAPGGGLGLLRRALGPRGGVGEREDDGRGVGPRLVLCKAPSVPQPVVQSRRRPLLGPSPG